MEAKVIIYKTETCPFVKGAPSASASAMEAREAFPDKGIYMPCADTREHLGEVWK